VNLGQIEVLYAVSPEVCLASVTDDPDAKGFSFYYAYDGFDTICVIFGNLEGEADCSHECTSFKYYTDCIKAIICIIEAKSFGIRIISNRSKTYFCSQLYSITKLKISLGLTV
jgi:hypothetical protein